MAGEDSESALRHVPPILSAPDLDQSFQFRGSTWVIFGAGGHARSVTDVVTRLGGIVIAVVGHTNCAWPVPVIKNDEEGFSLAASAGHRVALGIGAASVRETILAGCRSRGIATPSIVASTATVAGNSSIGLGTVVHEHAHVGPSVRIGGGAIVNTGAIVEHDCSIGDLVHLAPNSTALGGVCIGKAAEIGSAATLVPNVKIGASVSVGAGSVVLKDVPDDSTVVGVPARSIRYDPTTKDA